MHAVQLQKNSAKAEQFLRRERKEEEEEEDEEEGGSLLEELQNIGGSGGVQPSGGFIQVEDPGRDDQLQANIAAFAFATRNTSNKLCANLQTREHMHVEHRKTCNYDSLTKYCDINCTQYT